MNATTFFPETLFQQMKQDVADQKVLHFSETPYQKELKVKGNHYKLMITTGHYIVGNQEYYISLWHDYNYSNPKGSREIGGGCGAGVIMDSYEAFTEKIDRLLKKFPDYTEPVFEPVQLSLFW